MSTGRKSGLTNRQHRTRKDILEAASRLVGRGLAPTMDDVAAEALVSRATAYRYFPTVEALLVEASLDMVAPDADAVFAGDTTTDPEERIDRAEAALHEMTFGNEVGLRLMLAHTLQQAGKRRPDGTPIRQNRRTPLIRAALAPARRRFDDAGYERLCAALALLFGTEAMVVFRDVLQMDADEARAVKSWAARALVRAALQGAEAAPAGRAGDSPVSRRGRSAAGSARR